MKKLLLLSAILIGAATASQAGGFHLRLPLPPLPPLPGISIHAGPAYCPPAPVYSAPVVPYPPAVTYAPAPIYVPAPDVYLGFGYGYPRSYNYGYPYRHYGGYYRGGYYGGHYGGHYHGGYGHHGHRR
jgi:hypothetical protein